MDCERIKCHGGEHPGRHQGVKGREVGKYSQRCLRQEISAGVEEVETNGGHIKSKVE